MNFGQHLIIAPILVPLVTGALLLLIDERRRLQKAMIGLASTIILFVVAVALFRFADGIDGPETARQGVYLPGNWPAPFGIVLVVDRLSALMLVLSARSPGWSKRRPCRARLARLIRCAIVASGT